MKVRILVAGIFAMLYFSQYVVGQSHSGQVVDNLTKEPLAGASILLVGTETGALTDQTGKFSLEGNADSIRISMVGYGTKVYAIQDVPSMISMDQSIVELNQVVISANREARERDHIPVAISSIKPEILNDAKATSLEQVLNKVPGVFMNDLGNEQHMMSIRQPLSTKSIFLYLEDGIPIRTSGVFNHNALLEMNMTATRSIEVIRGPYSSLYGSEAIGGAINFITRKPSALPTGRVSIQGNNLGYRRADLLTSGTFGKVGVLIGGYYAMRRNGYREHSDFDKLALTGKVNYNISEKTIWQNSFTIVDYVSDMTGSLDSANFYGEEYSSLHTFTNRAVNAARFKSGLTHFWNKQSKTTVTGLIRSNSIKQNPSYRVKDDYSAWGNPNGDPSLAHGEVNDNSFKSYAGIVQHTQKFDWLGASITAGSSIDYSPNKFAANYITIDIDDAGIYSGFAETDSVLTDYEVGLLNIAGYIQGEITPFERLTLIGALRYDYFGYDYANNLGSTAFSGAPDSKNNFNAITPKVGLTYRFTKDIGGYANYSRGFVPPQVGELYRGVQVPSLEPANFDNYEVGGWINLFKGKAAIDLAGYQLDGQNEIISVRLGNGDTENQNAGQTRHQGVEYGLSVRPIPSLALRLSGANSLHTYMDFVESGSDYSGNQLPAAPSWIANAEATWKPLFVKGLRMGLEWQHVGPYYMDEANTKQYDGFDLFNLRLGYEIKCIEAWFHVMNLADVRYATRATRSRWGDSYSPGDPRTFNIGIGYRFAASSPK